MNELEVLQLLGKGGCASVYLCREKSTNNLVGESVADMWLVDSLFDGAALKKIPRDRVQNPKQKQRIETEQYLLENVRCPYLCRGSRLIDLNNENEDDSKEVVFVLDYIERATPLYQCIWNYRTTRRFPESVAKYFTAQLVLAIGHIHSLGYIHRDLKSGNVLVDKNGIAHVIDFGFSKCINNSETEKTHGVEGRTWSTCGTHYVMAPEMYTRESYGFEVDWWALGVIVHEMVGGKPPWAYTPPDTAPLLQRYFDQITSISRQCSFFLSDLGISEECRDVVQRLLAFNRSHRLGHRGVSEVMAHPWFYDIDWKVFQDFESHPNDLMILYNLEEDFNTSTSTLLPDMAPGKEPLSTSSAESIDEADNLKYFADF